MRKILYRLVALSLCTILIFLFLPSFALVSFNYENSGMEFMDETQAGNELYNHY